MGVPGIFAWLLRNKKKLNSNKLIKNALNEKIKFLMIDANCLLHPCVNNIIEKYKTDKLIINKNKSLRFQLEEYIWIKIESYIDDIIERINPEYIYIAIDGVAPVGKILQQRQRRYKYLYDKKIRLNKNEDIKCQLLDNGIELPDIPITSIELTPGTDYMERIHLKMLDYIKKKSKIGLKYIYSSYHDEGEGEHKILQYIKKNSIKSSIIIYGLDADLLFLSLSLNNEFNIYIMREKQVFNNKDVDLDELIEYNYVEIKELHKMIYNLGFNTNDFIFMCYLIGNDFLPSLLTTDIKKGGLDKICRAYENILNKFNLIRMDKNNLIISYLIIKKDNKYIINHEILIELFKELRWTEKYLWDNINRDKNIEGKDEELVNKEKINNLEKFISGYSFNTEFLQKIEFNSENEFYNHYLGLNNIRIDNLLIEKIVKDYITTLEWCVNYYFEECKSWSWGYNYLITPLINDIIKHYPKNIKLENIGCILNPVEQLILAIPQDTYKFVIEKEIISKIKNNKNIGYMFPESFDLDINKESIYWKCPVKIPIIEYEEYIDNIKKIVINNSKNLSYKHITNYNL